MAKNTSILLGDYFDNFINQLVESGKYSSVSEVIRTALRLFEEEERKKTVLINALKEGENSGFIDDFEPEHFLENLHDKYTDKK